MARAWGQDQRWCSTSLGGSLRSLAHGGHRNWSSTVKLLHKEDQQALQCVHLLAVNLVLTDDVIPHHERRFGRCLQHLDDGGHGSYLVPGQNVTRQSSSA